jgi:hypothetical protein
MSGLVLRLFTDVFGKGASLTRPLAPLNRALYVIDGSLTAAGQALSADGGCFRAGTLDMTAGADGARVLRFELLRQPQADHGLAIGEDVRSSLTLDADLPVDPATPHLMRLDKVTLPPGGIAYGHTQEGPGIRCLLEGAYSIQVRGKLRVVASGEAWFEAGADTVVAWAPPDQGVAFVRVLILPRRLKGHAAIRYVRDEDRDKPKPQTYTVYADEFVDV